VTQPPTRVLRLYHRQLGSHTHVRVFCGMQGFTLASCGQLTFRNEEWEDIQRLLRNAEILVEPPSSAIPSRRYDEND
jgi:hypothetical protein